MRSRMPSGSDLHGLRAGGLVGLRLRGLAALGRLGLRGLLRRVGLDLHFRILGDQRGGRILGEHRHIHAGHVGVGVVPFDAAVLRVQVAVGGEDQVLAVRAEGRAAAVVPALGDRVLLAFGEVVQVDDVHLVLGRAGVGDPLAVRGVLHAAELRFGILHHAPSRCGGSSRRDRPPRDGSCGRRTGCACCPGSTAGSGCRCRYPSSPGPGRRPSPRHRGRFRSRRWRRRSRRSTSRPGSRPRCGRSSRGYG